MRQSPFINIFARDFGWGIVIKRKDVWFTRMFLRNKLNWLKILFGSNPYTYLFHLFVIVRFQSILSNFMFWTNYQSVKHLISSISCSPPPVAHHILQFKISLNPIQGGGQKRLRASSSLNFDKNNHHINKYAVISSKSIVVRQKQKKGEIFWGNPPFSPSKKFQNPKKKNLGVSIGW